MTSWHDPDRLVAMIQDRFAFLSREHGFSMVLIQRSPPVTVAYEQSFLQTLTRVRISADVDANEFDIQCGWPDQVQEPTHSRPTVSLAEIIAMRDPALDVPRDLSGESTADATIARAAAVLGDLASDVLSGGGFGLMFDYVVWKRAQGDLGEGEWWGAPLYEELARSGRPRTDGEIKRDLEWQPIHARVHRDPESAWPDVIDFVRRHAATAEATMLIEDLIFDHGDSFIDRIEVLARSDSAFRSTVDGTAIGGIAGAAIDRFEDLQAEIRGDR